MAGTFSTDLTLIKAAELTTDYTLVGSLKSAMTLNDDYKLESTNCITCGVSSATGTGTASILAITSAALNFDTTHAGKHFFMWIKGIAWASMATRAAGGLAMSISSDAPPTAVISVLSAVVVNGGTSGTYAVSDVLTVVGGTGTAATLTVTGVSAGKVTTVIPTASARGSYTVFPTNPVSITGGGGTGATFTLTSIYTTTNSKQWFVGGSNTDSVVGWTNYVVDPVGTPDISIGSPTTSNINRMGFRMTATAVVKVANFIFDVSRYGFGSTINDGTGTTPVTMADYVAYDNANARAWGVVTSQNSIYFVCGKLNIGTVAQSAETIFKEQANVFVYQDFPVASGFYEISVVGASGQKTTFQLGNYDPASGLASGGCTIRGSGNVNSSSRTDGTAGAAHSSWKLTASDANQVTKLYGSTFSEMLSAALAYNAVSIELTTNCTTNGTVTLVTSGSYDTSGIVIGMKVTGTNIAADTYVSSIESATSLTMNSAATGSGSSLTMTFTHNNEIRSCTFSNFGAITTNGCVIDNCTFQDVKTGAPISSTFALIVASSTEVGRVTNCKFISCNRAIKITASGSYTFTNLTFSGNSYDVENSAASGTVTISATAGSDPGTYAYINTGISFEASAAQSYNANTTTYTNEATDIGNATVNDVALPPIQATTAGDAIYLGHSSTFTGVTLVLGTKGTYSNITITWQYWNGAWTTITDVVDNTSSFTAVAGTYTINFRDPIDNADWATTAVNGTTKYWIRAVTSFAASPSVTTAPLGTQAWHGYTLISKTVTLTATVKDANGTAVSGARVRIETSGGTLISNGSTNGSGIYSDATYNYGGDVAVNVIVRLKGYINFKTTGTIGSSGLDVGVRFIKDEIVNLP